MRECGSCTLCCTWLYQEAYGQSSGNGKPCGFLCSIGCSIYEQRPRTCSYYECAWKQGLFPEWMKPNECGIIISVSNWTPEKQFLDIIETNIELQEYVFRQVESFAKINNCGVRYKKRSDDKVYYYGPDDFIQHFEDNSSL